MIEPRELAPTVYELLKKQHGSIDERGFIVGLVSNKSLFEFIVAVVLSQNTNDLNAIKAYRNLASALGEPITPLKVLSSPLSEIASSIRVAGMYSVRARRIVELANLFSSEGFVRDLRDFVERSSVEEARRKLLELPGVGLKTADVILLMYFKRATFPVDTHIARITRRLLGLSRLNYEELRSFWMNGLDPSKYLEAHFLLIVHGRKICTARRPKCSACSISSYCKYSSRELVVERGRAMSKR